MNNSEGQTLCLLIVLKQFIMLPRAYLLDTTSAEERKSWIEAISKAVQPVEAKKK